MANIEDWISGIENDGYRIVDFVKAIGKRNTSFMQLDDNAHDKFCKLLDKLDSKDGTSHQRGRLLEELTFLLFDDCYKAIIKCLRNMRTSTNEIDLLISWTQSSRVAGIKSAYPCFGDRFICECKNYEDKVGVTYIGKFYSLLSVSDCKFGVIVSLKGISGRGKWSDGKGLVKKIALKENIYIVDLDINDLRKIRDKKDNVFNILYQKYETLKLDIDYSKYIQKHENEEDFESL